MIVDRCCWNPCFLSLGHNFSRRRTYTHTHTWSGPALIYLGLCPLPFSAWLCSPWVYMVARIRGALSRKQHLMELPPPLLLLPWRGIKIYVRYGGDLSGFTAARARWSCPVSLSCRTKGRTRTKSSDGDNSIWIKIYSFFTLAARIRGKLIKILWANARALKCLSAVRPLMIIFISSSSFRVIYFEGNLLSVSASLSKSIIESLSIKARAGPFLSISNSHNSRDSKFDQDARKLAINQLSSPRALPKY